MPVARNYELHCPDTCSLRPGTPNSEWVSDGLVGGKSYRLLVAEGAAREPMAALNGATLGRHKKHIVVIEVGDPVNGDEESLGKSSELAVLDAIITAGWRNRKNWKPTIGDTLKAMDMRLKLTQGSVFGDLMDELHGAVVDEDEAPAVPENPAAVMGESEAEAVGAIALR